jgi:hypothetical protein
MNKFSTAQLQAALIELRNGTQIEAWCITFDEVNRRMGDDAFDAWCEALGR